eukprot:GDKI01045205.1.p1 GENE.GDKI01045205.1~~GDKI01045205.1.p1  ORF type:complete len:160 (-),score=36.51 GDKI01045205.1:28-507(-)
MDKRRSDRLVGPSSLSSKKASAPVNYGSGSSDDDSEDERKKKKRKMGKGGKGPGRPAADMGGGEAGWTDGSKLYGIRRAKHEKRALDLLLEEDDTDHSRVLTFRAVAVGPSKLPKRHFCAVCHYIAQHSGQCPKCFDRCCSAKCLAAHQEEKCMKFGGP